MAWMVLDVTPGWWQKVPGGGTRIVDAGGGVNLRPGGPKR